MGIWIAKFFENRVQQIPFEETTYETSIVKSGSVQGCVLGTVFFLMFIQDISKDMTVNLTVFVDDTNLKEKILGEEDVSNMDSTFWPFPCMYPCTPIPP